ncbi:MAG TPA: hypothetical protein VGJ20_46115 [Xanthobacteraceae bacterium]
MTTSPGYWMHETGGKLSPAMQRYLLRKPLSDEDIALIRAYLRQWIMAPVWDANPHADNDDRWALGELRRHIDDLMSREVIDCWIDWAIDEGFDPL